MRKFEVTFETLSSATFVVPVTMGRSNTALIDYQEVEAAARELASNDYGIKSELEAVKVVEVLKEMFVKESKSYFWRQ